MMEFSFENLKKSVIRLKIPLKTQKPQKILYYTDFKMVATLKTQ